MLKRIVAWIDKVESTEWQTNNDMKDFVMNCVANLVTSPNQQRLDGNNNNKQIFWR